ncbi:RAB GTPase, putative [Ixodes scapularis]|uniref:RAB GTPase, putative n=1 Tax=Ixodes scapularis TaxID=6945 RepID=B7QGE0_IXOSC|nr:RAB GTPase, putative [Ixodes scapularis]|eukprot:XP_002401511.1 RAB GTPase, putative [Ixodes scapularis]
MWDDSGLSTLRSVAEADTQVDNSFDTTLAFDATLPSLSSDTVSLRPRSLSSVTSPVLDREDSLDSSAAALAASQRNACLGPPVTLRHRKLKSERSVESLPPTLGDIAAKSPAVREERATSVSASSESGIGSRNTWCSDSLDSSAAALAASHGNACLGPPVTLRHRKLKSERSVESLPPTLGDIAAKSPAVREERATSVSASSESGIGSRNTWCSMESIDGSPKAPTRGNLSSRRISEIKRQLGVDPVTARSRIPLSTEPKPRPRKHLSRQDKAVTSLLDDVDSHFEEPPVFDEDCPRTSTPQPKVAVAESSLNRVQRAASFTSCTGPPEHTFKVVFVGDAAVGKSSFIMRLSRGIFMPQLTSTLGVDFQTKNIHIDGVNVSLQLWDTAGQERFRCITQSYFRKADGVMLMYDCTNEQSFLNVRQWITMMKRAVPDEDDKVTLSEKGGKSFTSKCCNKQ